MSVVALSGGVGGAKLALGLYHVLPAGMLTVVVNTGDDFEHFGLRVCPDIDTVLYTLAGLASRERGWGRSDDSWNLLRTLESLGEQTWFQLGDADTALHLARTRRLQAGESLTQVTSSLGRQLGIAAHILPVSDQPVRTSVRTSTGSLPFQDYFVRAHCEPTVERIFFDGHERASVSEAVQRAFGSDDLEAIVICPSNPYLSIDPMLAIPGMRALLELRRVPCIAVSPLIGGRAVKGPTSKIMRELGIAASNKSIDRHYRGLIDGLVIDSSDVADGPALDVPSFAHPTLMTNAQEQVRLARFVLDCVGLPTQR